MFLNITFWSLNCFCHIFHKYHLVMKFCKLSKHFLMFTQKIRFFLFLVVFIWFYWSPNLTRAWDQNSHLGSELHFPLMFISFSTGMSWFLPTNIFLFLSIILTLVVFLLRAGVCVVCSSAVFPIASSPDPYLPSIPTKWSYFFTEGVLSTNCYPFVIEEHNFHSLVVDHISLCHILVPKMHVDGPPCWLPADIVRYLIMLDNISSEECLIKNLSWRVKFALVVCAEFYGSHKMKLVLWNWGLKELILVLNSMIF